MFNVSKYGHSCCSSDIYIHVTAVVLGFSALWVSVHLQGRGWLAKPVPLFFVPEQSTLVLEYLSCLWKRGGKSREQSDKVSH